MLIRTQQRSEARTGSSGQLRGGKPEELSNLVFAKWLCVHLFQLLYLIASVNALLMSRYHRRAIVDKLQDASREIAFTAAVRLIYFDRKLGLRWNYSFICIPSVGF